MKLSGFDFQCDVKSAPDNLDKLGRITLPQTYLEHFPHLIQDLLLGCIPLRMECGYGEATMILWHPAFAPLGEVERGCVRQIPNYALIVEHETDDEGVTRPCKLRFADTPQAATIRAIDEKKKEALKSIESQADALKDKVMSI